MLQVCPGFTHTPANHSGLIPSQKWASPQRLNFHLTNAGIQGHPCPVPSRPHPCFKTSLRADAYPNTPPRFTLDVDCPIRGGTERCEHSQECAYSNLSRCSMARSSQSLPPLRSTSLLHISAMTRGIRGYAAGMLVPSGWQANARRCCFYCDKLGVEFRLAHFPLGIIAPAPSQFTL